MSKKLLLVVDDRLIRKTIKRIAKSMGYIVHVVDNGWDAVEAVCLRSYDLVLVRSELFGMSGMETAQCIRAVQNKEGLKKIPILNLLTERPYQIVENALSWGDNLLSGYFNLSEISSYLSNMDRLQNQT